MAKDSKSEGGAPSGAQRAEGETSTTTESKSEGGAQKTEAPKRPPYAVAPGKAVTTRRRGLAQEGQEVTAEDFGGGADRLAELVRKGVVVKS